MMLLYLITSCFFLIYDLLVMKRISISALTMAVTGIFVLTSSGAGYGDFYFFSFAFFGVLVAYLVEVTTVSPIIFKEPVQLNIRSSDLLKVDRVEKFAHYLALTGFLFMFIRIFEVSIKHGGIVSAFLRLRVEEYLKGGIVEASLLSPLIYVLTPFVILYIGRNIELKQYKQFTFGMLVVLCYYLMLAETRLPLLFLIMTPVIYYFINSSFSKRFILFIFGSIFFPIAFIFYINLGAMIRSGAGGRIDFSSLLSMEKFNSQLGYRGWVNDLVTYVDVNGFSYGIQWFVNPIITFVPRFFWADKPITSTSNYLHTVVGGFSMGDGNYITTYTIFGEGYFQYGYIGVFLASLLMVGCLYVIARLSRVFLGYRFFMIWTVLRFIPFIRAEVPVFLVLTYIIEIFLLLFLSRLKIK